MPTSSIVAIGDELVGGFTLDTNSHWMAERLRLLGYPIKRVTQIRDRPSEIIEQVHRELDDAEVTDIFVSGGLGPTPDDRTFTYSGRPGARLQKPPGNGARGDL
ncbi:MAG: hypothetical protein E6J08_10260 [Chloroflexi bacterium]|nr:MAG: hypothetical protein E6J08_10260 [Chloroflexota bacterium]